MNNHLQLFENKLIEFYDLKDMDQIQGTAEWYTKHQKKARLHNLSTLIADIFDTS